MIARSPYGSQRRFARKIRGRHGKALDPAALSLMLRGKRSIQLHEAKQFSDLLDVPLIEILRRAGIATPESAGAHPIPVAGYLDREGFVHLHDAKDSPEMVPGLGELPKDTIAIRCRTARSENDMIDGWLLFAERPGVMHPDTIGRLCVVSPKDHKASVAFVLRGYRSGTFNLVPWRPGHPEPAENIALEWAAPIRLIRPS